MITKENGGKDMQDAERLAEELQKYPRLEKVNKVYKERETRRKMLGEQLSRFNSIFMNNKKPSHTLKCRTFFVITFAKKSIVQIA